MKNSTNLLSIVYPELAERWNKEKNGELTPDQVTVGSSKEVYWSCEKGHTFPSKVQTVVRSHRNGSNGCPYCSGKLVALEDSLHTLHPHLAAEWHTEKNGTLKPTDVLCGSTKKVWWKCEFNHEWDTRISHRVNGSGCPTCNQGSQTSFPEQSIYYYIKSIFTDAESRYKYQRNDRVVEFDVYVPDYRLAIEYDGAHYHKDKVEKDTEKGIFCKEEGITLIRVRENGCPALKDSSHILSYKYKTGNPHLDSCLQVLFNTMIPNLVEDYALKDKLFSLNVDVKRDQTAIAEQYSGQQQNSLEKVFPEIAKEWHPTLNNGLTPDKISYGSTLEVQWICSEGHVYPSTVNARTSGKGCGFCNGKRIDSTNSLRALHPDIAAEWHTEKNGELTPDAVTSGSQKKVWWKCSDNHEWQMTVGNRVLRGQGCKKCKAKKVPAARSLERVYPLTAVLWDSSKNKDLTPAQVYATSRKIVHWRCRCGESWERSVAQQVRAKGCPCCK